jgi:hypothetical protein
VRTAATELRKKLATYYVDEKHRSELRMGLIPGSYIPRFTLPGQARHGGVETEIETELPEAPFETHAAHIRIGPVPVKSSVAGAGPVAVTDPVPVTRLTEPAPWWRQWYAGAAAAVVLMAAGLAGYNSLHKANAESLFWKPVLETPGAVLLVVGDHPNGPPTVPDVNANGSPVTPVPSSDSSQTVPFADTVTIAKVVGALEARNKQVIIRRGSESSFSDLRSGAAVLIGAFNNEWSLRLTRQLRFSLAMDTDQHVVYIRDAKNPSSRSWSWGTNQPPEPVTGANSPKLQDFALISRIRDSETGHVVVVIGGLYTYGTETAGEFLTDPKLMEAIAKQLGPNRTEQNLQIVLGTTVTDGTPGPPRVLAVSVE